jgi:hypothetical protein
MRKEIKHIAKINFKNSFINYILDIVTRLDEKVNLAQGSGYGLNELTWVNLKFF